MVPQLHANLYISLAILKRDIHPYIVFGDVKEGSYINVTKYQLARVKKRTGHGDIL